MKPLTKELLDTIGVSEQLTSFFALMGAGTEGREHFPELIAVIADVYETFYTEDEIGELLAFMRDSSAGRKYITQGPAMLKASFEAGVKWYQRYVAQEDEEGGYLQ